MSSSIVLNKDLSKALLKEQLYVLRREGDATLVGENFTRDTYGERRVGGSLWWCGFFIEPSR